MVDFVERSPKNPNKRPGPKPPPAAGRPKPRKIHEDDVQVKCPACGRAFGVLTALAGSEAVCPGCSKPVQVPPAKGQAGGGLKKPDAAAPQRSKPKPVSDPGAKKAAPAAESGAAEKKPSIRKVRQKVDLKTQPKCPECEAVLELDAVLCVKCGYDLRKEQQNVTKRQKKLNPLIPIIVLLALLGGSYAVYEFVLKPKDEATTATPGPTQPIAEEPAPSPASETTPAVDPEPMVEAEPEPVPEPEPVVEAEPEPMPEPEPVVEAEPEPMPEPEPVVVEDPVDPREKIRSLMVGKLDAQYPVAGVGDTVSLTTMDGTEYTGALTAIDGDTVRLQQDGTEIDLPMKNLERRSRARLDTTYREAMIDQLTDKYLARQATAN